MIEVKKSWCKSCGLCILNCPKKAISKSGEFNLSGYEVITIDEDLCIECGVCYTVCPDMVISIK